MVQVRLQSMLEEDGMGTGAGMPVVKRVQQ